MTILDGKDGRDYPQRLDLRKIGTTPGDELIRGHLAATRQRADAQLATGARYWDKECDDYVYGELCDWYESVMRSAGVWKVDWPAGMCASVCSSRQSAMKSCYHGTRAHV